MIYILLYLSIFYVACDTYQHINNPVFSLAAGKLGKVTGMDKNQINSLANKAKESWGIDVNKWSVPQVIEAGNMLSKFFTYLMD